MLQVAGRLHVELGRVSGSFPQDRQGDADSEDDDEDSYLPDSMIDDDEFVAPVSKNIVVRVSAHSSCRHDDDVIYFL